MNHKNKYPHITFQHFRVPGKYLVDGNLTDTVLMPYRRSAPSFKSAPVGGLTICVIEWDDATYTRGEALCSRRDQFCYKTGRELAEERARQAYESEQFSVGPITDKMQGVLWGGI